MRRELGLGDAVLIGLGAMLGAGVFAAFAPAAAAAGSAVLVSLGVAGLIAYCNASSTASLAAVHPHSGGAYLYGRRQLGPTWGFIAGWGFVIGKTASCAAMALTAGQYAWPDHPRPVAIAVTVALTAVNYLGITKTARLNRVLLAVTVAVLLLVIAACLGSADADPARLRLDGDAGVHGILQAAGLLFFAFAGYARIATLGEEVRDPARTILRAVPIALGLVLALYAAIGLSLLLVLGPEQLGAATAPLEQAVAGAWPGLARLVRVAAVTACLGVLLSAMAGIGRTTLAMARDHELPGVLAAVHPKYAVPHHAELLLGAVVIALVAAVDLRGAIGFSSVGVLAYYGIANASAWTLPRASPIAKGVAVAGLAGCLTLVVSLPVVSVVTGLGVLGVGLAVHLLRGDGW